MARDTFLGELMWCTLWHPRAASTNSLAQPGRTEHWPAPAQAGAGPRAACARCGDAWTPPHRSHPSHAAEGSGSDGWYRGSPRACGFLGWGSPSSGAVHTASPRERRSLEFTLRVQSSRGWLDCSEVPSHVITFFVKIVPTDLGRSWNSLTTQKPTNNHTGLHQCLRIFTPVTLSPFLSHTFSVNLQFLCRNTQGRI